MDGFGGFLQVPEEPPAARSGEGQAGEASHCVGKSAHEVFPWVHCVSCLIQMMPHAQICH